MAKDHGPVGEERNGAVWWLLNYITCGIMGLVWYFKGWSEVAEFTKKDINPMTKILFLFIPIFNYFWMIYMPYSLFKEINEMEEKVGIPEDERINPIVNLLLMCVAGIGLIFAQNHLNKVWENA